MIWGKIVHLRGIEREDLKLLHRYLNDEEVMAWARSRPDHTISMEALEKEYELELKGEDTRRRTFIIVENESGKPIGWASIRWHGSHSTTADIGLALGERDMRGKGIGTEVNQLLTSLAFDQYNMHKVELWTLAENKAAINSAAKNGYQIEGTLRETVFFNGSFHDAVLMGITKDDYISAKANRR
jgi:RimJ/RimL family protein N-acetyltransferase